MVTKISSKILPQILFLQACFYLITGFFWCLLNMEEDLDELSDEYSESHEGVASLLGEKLESELDAFIDVERDLDTSEIEQL